MKKPIIIGLAIILAALSIWFFLFREKEGRDEVYLIPEGYTGCVVIAYDQPNEPSLRIINDKLVYKIPENGILKTSSHYGFGWLYKDDSGWFNAKYFYVNDEGKKVKEIPQENIDYEYYTSETDGSGKEDSSLYSFYLARSKEEIPESVKCPGP